MAKKRIDLLLVERGLAESRRQAQELVLAGHVMAADRKVQKTSQIVDSEACIVILGALTYVSRGGAKLKAAIDEFGISVRGRICLDLGASTGGFTDCLLQEGAREVYAFDVGNGQLAQRLRSDPRIRVHDGFNVRYLTGRDIPDQATLIAIDLSFISLTTILPPLRRALQARSRNLEIDVLALVKPQFEVGKGNVGKGGIVRDSTKQATVLRSLATFAEDTGFRVRGPMPSPILQEGGNQEFFLHLQLLPDL